MYSLIFAEEAYDSMIDDSIIGPITLNDEDDCHKELFSYVKKRIPAMCREDFLDAADSVGLPLTDYIDPYSDEVTGDELSSFFDALTVDEKQTVNFWYFNYLKMQGVNCFYRITQILNLNISTPAAA